MLEKLPFIGMAALVSFPAMATPATASSVGSATPSPAIADNSSVADAVIPALLPVVLEIRAPVGSRTSMTGDRFPIALKEPIVIEGRTFVAAGTPGEGEVVHAKKAGGGGSAGELVLAARFLRVGDRQLRLRSMRLAVSGRDAIGGVDAANAASAVSPLPVGLIGFAITGRNVELPAGTVASAKVAEDFWTHAISEAVKRPELPGGSVHEGGKQQ